MNDMGPGFARNLWHAAGLVFWIAIFKLLNRVQVFGREHIPKRGDAHVLILSNHISSIDPFLIGITAMPFFSPIWWRAPAKAELFEIPLIKNILASWGAIPVRRGQRDLKSVRRLVQMLSRSVIVAFPEGRRSLNGQLLPGRAGMGKVIYDSRPQKVIPVYIHGTNEILPKGRILPRLFKTVTIIYGPPLNLSAFYRMDGSAEVSQKIIDEVMRGIGRLRDQLRKY
jgi:1-acyl-sn-glycerol-3-phosphate acyltransferase